MLIGGSLVTWGSKKQTLVAKSSTEDKFRSMTQGIYQLLRIRMMFSDLGMKLEGLIKLYCDNKLAISIAHNPIHYDRTKHMEINQHFIKEKLESRLICIPYIASNGQLSNFLTKGLSSSTFQSILGKLRMENIFEPAWGGVLKLYGLIYRLDTCRLIVLNILKICRLKHRL